MSRSEIQWTDWSWNPVRGCTRCSPGCQNCYAEALAGRFCGPGLAFEGFAVRRGGQGRWTGEVEVVTERIYDPLGWKKPRRVFVNSTSDLFHPQLVRWESDEIARIFAVMAAVPQHQFQVLTKRPEEAINWFADAAYTIREISESDEEIVMHPTRPAFVWPLPNVWIGVSVESQEWAQKRLPLLQRIPAAIRFASAEPVLGPMDLRQLGLSPNDPWLDWLIVGGESGPGARPCDLDWISSLRDQAVAAGAPVFVKQLGSTWAKEVRAKHRKGGDPAEWPEALRVRQFPLDGPGRAGG